MALGNASLLGVGYLLMRRWQLAIGAVATTLVLVLIVSGTGQPGWPWRAILLVWWVATVAHGWRLANGRWAAAALAIRGVPPPAWRQRAAAAAAALAVLATLSGLAIDSRQLTASALDAHRAGDCDRATATFGRIGGRHRLVDPGVTTQANRNEEACELLAEALDMIDRQGRPRPAVELLAEYTAHPGALWEGASHRRADLLLSVAADRLDRALGGNTDALADGVAIVEQVLDEIPDRGDDVAAAIAGYETGLQAASPCDARDNADWFSGPGARQLEHPELARLGDAVEEQAPELLLACGEERLGSSSAADREEAREIFELILADHPDHPVAAVAADRIVPSLLDGWPARVPEGGDRPPYCFTRAPNLGDVPTHDWRPGHPPAAAYDGEGPHRIVPFGRGINADPSWTATGLDDAVLVVCSDGPARGSALGRSCGYRGRQRIHTVPLHASAYTLRVIELRTGDLVDETTLEFGGDCPLQPSDEFGDYEPPGSYGDPDYAMALPAPGSVGQATRAAIREWVFP